MFALSKSLQIYPCPSDRLTGALFTEEGSEKTKATYLAPPSQKSLPLDSDLPAENTL